MYSDNDDWCEWRRNVKEQNFINNAGNTYWKRKARIDRSNEGSKKKKMYENNLLSLSSCTMNLNFAFSPFFISQTQPFSPHKRNLPTLVSVSANSAGDNDGGVSAAKKGSGTTARGRRLLKVREEKRKRDYDRLHDYPAWAKYFSLSILHSKCLCFFLSCEKAWTFCWIRGNINAGYWRVHVKTMKSFELFLVIA